MIMFVTGVEGRDIIFFGALMSGAGKCQTLIGFTLYFVGMLEPYYTSGLTPQTTETAIHNQMSANYYKYELHS